VLQLHNETPFKATMAVLPDRAGIDTLYVIVKATVTLQPRLVLAPEQLPPVMADEYYGDPANTSLKAVSDLHIGKPGTDVLITGRAKAPRPATEMEVRVSVAERQVSLRVLGDRVWRGDGTASEPEPFTEMPLVWERAYGGVHHTGERILAAEERNPVGRGFLGDREPKELEGSPAPNLLDPAAPLEKLGDQAAPACFAPSAPAWLPRRQFAGTYDEAWQRSRAPYLPDDFDPRFLQCASGEMRFERFLQGSEPVRITGMTLEGPIEFSVPTVRPQIEVVVAGSPASPRAELETLWIEPDENRASLIWRAHLGVDRKALKVEKVTISLPQRGSPS
jgi:hypothetical protein